MKPNNTLPKLFVLCAVIYMNGCGDSAAPKSAGGVDTFDSAVDTTPLEDGGSMSTDGDSWVNIIAVDAAGSENAYTFNVTIESSDIDCTQFADWWEVVSPDGSLRYRRILAHPHTEGLSGNPVTRGGGPVPISADEIVIVRGHMNNAGYVGIAMRGSVNTGFVQATDIDHSFAPEVESESPQPSICIPEEDVVGK